MDSCVTPGLSDSVTYPCIPFFFPKRPFVPFFKPPTQHPHRWQALKEIVFLGSFFRNVCIPYYHCNKWSFCSPRLGSSGLCGLTVVVPGLALCGAGAVSTRALCALQVSCVVSAAPELPDTPLPAPDTPFLRVSVKDDVDEDLKQHFDLVADLIEQVIFIDSTKHCIEPSYCPRRGRLSDFQGLSIY